MQLKKHSNSNATQNPSLNATLNVQDIYMKFAKKEEVNPNMSNWSAQNEGDLIGERMAVTIENGGHQNGLRANNIILCWHFR